MAPQLAKHKYARWELRVRVWNPQPPPLLLAFGSKAERARETCNSSSADIQKVRTATLRERMRVEPSSKFT